MRYPATHPLFLSRHTVQDYAATLLVYASLTGRRDIAARYFPSFRSVLGEWPEGAIAAAALDASIPRNKMFTHVRSAVRPDCVDPELLFVVGEMARHAGESAEAIRCYERSLAAEPHLFPNTYLLTAELHVRLGHPDLARQTLQRCIDNCLLAPERMIAIQRLEELQATPEGR
jgi:tetratricopeptide (TPR) repeat protein